MLSTMPKNAVGKIAELGMLKNIASFNAMDSKIGRINIMFMDIDTLINREISSVINIYPNLIQEYKSEILITTMKLSAIFTRLNKTKHVGSFVSFCISYINNSVNTFPKELTSNLTNIVEYYLRDKKIKESELWTDKKFKDAWDSYEL